MEFLKWKIVHRFTALKSVYTKTNECVTNQLDSVSGRVTKETEYDAALILIVLPFSYFIWCLVIVCVTISSVTEKRHTISA